MKQIEEEYYRTDEKSQAPNTATTAAATAATTAGTTMGASTGSASSGTTGAMDYLHTPSPANPIISIPPSAIPPLIRDAHQSLRESQTLQGSSMVQVQPVYDSYAPPMASMYVPSVYYPTYSPLPPLPRSPPAPPVPSAPVPPAPAPAPSAPAPVPSSTVRSVPPQSESSTEMNQKRYPARFRDLRKKHESPSDSL